MSKWAVILSPFRPPHFVFKQTIVGAFDFLPYLLCVCILFAMCAFMRKICSFDVFTNSDERLANGPERPPPGAVGSAMTKSQATSRSEERRVGEEWGSWEVEYQSAV